MTSCNVVPAAAAEKSLLNKPKPKTSKALVGGAAALFVLGDGRFDDAGGVHRLARRP